MGVTMAESLSAGGLCDGAAREVASRQQQRRLPNDQGFDEWYGIPRTTDEAMWPVRQVYSPSISSGATHGGAQGRKSRDVKVYDLEQRRLIDAEITRRQSHSWNASPAKKPFFVMRR